MPHHGRDGVFVEGATEVVALHGAASETAQDEDVFGRFDPFDDADEVQVAAEIDDRLDDVAAGLFRRQARHEAAIDLDLVDRQAVDVTEAGIAGAEVVERNL